RATPVPRRSPPPSWASCSPSATASPTRRARRSPRRRWRSASGSSNPASKRCAEARQMGGFCAAQPAPRRAMKEDARMDEEQSLGGRVIAIAGVGGGLGPAVAARLAEAGAIVAGANRSQADVDAVGEELGLPSEQWDGRAVDLTDEDAVAAWRDALVERFG